MKQLLASAVVPISVAMSPAYAADMDRVVFHPPADAYQQVADEDRADTEHLSGFAEGSFGYGSGSTAGLSANGTTWALRGSFNARTNTVANFQLDAGYAQTEMSGVQVGSLDGAVHAYYRQPDGYAVGAFVQGARVQSNLLNLLAPLGLANHAVDVVAGGEAAFQTKYATIHGQLGFGRAFYSGVGANHLTAKAGVRIFALDDLRFDVEGAFNRYSLAGGNASVYSAAAIANYRLPNVPLTTFAGYRYDHGVVSVLGATVGTASSHTALGGIRFHFGTKTLKEEDRTGPMWTSSSQKL